MCKIILSSFLWIFVVFIPVLAKGWGTRKIYFCSAYFITNAVEPYVLDPEEAYLRNLQFPLRVLQSLWVPLWFLVHREESYFIWAELPFLVCHLYFQFLHLLLQVNDRKIFLANGAADFINGPNILLRKQSKKLGHSEAAVRGVLKKRCSEKMQQIYRRAPMTKCNFNQFSSNFIEITLWHGCSPVNLLHIFRTSFLKNTSGWLLVDIVLSEKIVSSIISHWQHYF